MHSAFEQEGTQFPLVRITTLGEFAIVRLERAPSRRGDEPARYERVGRSEWSNRGPAMALLKVLLCRANRRACRDELIEAIWPDNGQINAAHALDSAASVLRRHILPTGEVAHYFMRNRTDGLDFIPFFSCMTGLEHRSPLLSCALLGNGRRWFLVVVRVRFLVKPPFFLLAVCWCYQVALSTIGSSHGMRNELTASEQHKEKRDF